MESKLNYSAIEDYSEKFSDNLIESFFKNKSTINGKEILALFELKQVNLFVLQYIFERWKKEAVSLRSPYFDNDNEDVKLALEAYMNLLSKHIKIDRVNFRPLLLQAVMDTILLISSPYDFYHMRLKQNEDDKILLSSLKESAKYIKINSHLHQALIEQLEKKNQIEISGEDTIKYLDEVIATISAPPEDFDEFEAQFSKIAPLNVEKFYEEEHIREESSPKEDVLTVNEKFFQGRKTLMDEISVESKSTLAELHQKKKIKSIKKHISINQRFMFVNELFSGDSDALNSALEEIEGKDNYDNALDYIIKHFAKPNDWVMDSEEVIEFLSVVAKRFG